MGQRQVGLVRVGMRRGNTPASTGPSGITSINQGWDPNRWYLPGTVDTLAPGGSGSIGLAAVGNSDGKLKAISQLFLQAGKITDIGVQYGNPVSGHPSLSALYRSSTSKPYQPGALAFSNEWNAGGFNVVQTLTLPGGGVSVAAGERIWFGANSSNQDSGSEFVVAVPTALQATLGTNWDGVTPVNTTPAKPTFGWFVTLAYSYPPPDPFPTLAETDAIISTTFAAIPTFAFRFKPS